MSFVESWSVASEAATDPAFTLCVTGVLLIIGLLAAVPAVAGVLRLFQTESRLGKLLLHLLHIHHRRH